MFCQAALSMIISFPNLILCYCFVFYYYYNHFLQIVNYVMSVEVYGAGFC